MKFSRVVLVAVAILSTLVGLAPRAYADDKSPALAGILSGIVLPGTGQMYDGQVGRGVGILLGEGALLSVYSRNQSTALGVGVIALHIWQAVDAANLASRYNKRHAATAKLAAERAALGRRFQLAVVPMSGRDGLSPGGLVAGTVRF